MGIFIYAFTATGKSSVAKKYKNIIDMESTIYKYLDTIEDEKLKGTDRQLNKEWPNNYFKALDEVKDKYDYILISDDICNEYLEKNNYEYWWIYPKKELKEEYLQRCRNRGNNDTFIHYYDINWNEWIDACINDKNASKHIELESNEYLEDVIPNLRK